MTCQCTPVAEARFGAGNERSPSTAVVEGIATAEGVAPTDLEPLFGEIDPEALDDLFAGADRDTAIAFPVGAEEWNVFVRGDGIVRVCDPATPAEPAPAFERSECNS